MAYEEHEGKYMFQALSLTEYQC